MSRIDIPSSSYKALIIWLDPAEHLRLKRALKILAASQGRTFKQLVVEALNGLLAKYAEEGQS